MVIINLKGKSEFSPIESVYDDEQEMLKKVWETRKQLSEERWILKLKKNHPKTTQTYSFSVTLKTIDGELSLEYDNWMKMKWRLFLIIILVLVWFSLPFLNDIIEFLFS